MSPTVRADDAPRVSAPKGPLHVLVLEVQVNDGAPRIVKAMRQLDGALLFSRDDLHAWRVTAPGAPVQVVDGVAYHDLGHLPGASVAFDDRTQSVRITLPAPAFETNRISTFSFTAPPLSRSTFGAFLNYQGAAWSTPFRFGGIQFGTRLALRPGFISYPTPTLNGGAALPSAVEVYVNDTLRYQGKVEPGPFALNNVPVLTGAGEMRFTVKDPMGVGRTVSTPYYVRFSRMGPDWSFSASADGEPFDRAWRQRAAVYLCGRSRSAAKDATLIGLSLTVMLGERQSASLSARRDSGRATALAEFTRAAPADEGWGYRVAASGGEYQSAQAQATWRSRFSTRTAEAAGDRRGNALRLLASGSLGYAAGIPFAMQQASDAFAVVTVDGAADQDIYRENQLWTRTDAKGRAVVSGLRPYEINRISIDSTQLPIATQLRRDALTIVPRQGGFATAAFDVESAQGATLTVLLPDGQPLPAGSEIRGGDGTPSTVSGFGGMVLVERPRAGDRLEALWAGGRCGFVLPPIPRSAPMPQLGTVRCEANRRSPTPQ